MDRKFPKISSRYFLCVWTATRIERSVGSGSWILHPCWNRNIYYQTTVPVHRSRVRLQRCFKMENHVRTKISLLSKNMRSSSCHGRWLLQIQQESYEGELIVYFISSQMCSFTLGVTHQKISLLFSIKVDKCENLKIEWNMRTLFDLFCK